MKRSDWRDRPDALPPPLKRLGQNFLTDSRVLDRVADALELVPGETVVEIGAGRGALTRILVSRDARVVAVEIDRALVVHLRNEFLGNPAVQIVEGDALRIALGSIGGDGAKVVGNVPYYITTPLLFHLLRPPRPTVGVFMVQQEVADRAVAGAGSAAYGSLSVNLQALAHVEKLFEVGPESFTPRPTVRSAVIRLTPLQSPLIPGDQEEQFRKLVQALFSGRRKQLQRSLRTITGRDADAVSDALRQIGIDPMVRVEELPPERFVDLLRLTRGELRIEL